MKTIIFTLLIIAALLGYVVMVYNKLIALIEAVKNNKKQIDIQLDRRFKVFESLIEVVKKYMDYEKSTLKDVVALRAQATQAVKDGNVPLQMDAENKISQIAGGLNLVFENYPDLKANQNAMQLQEEIVNTENKLAYSKQAYNDSIETFNANKKSFFESMVVGAFPGKLDQEFDYWGLSEDAVKQNESYTVKLS